jgi:hypothetical protein
MSKKVNWAEVDKRIRNRRKDFSADEMKTVQAALDKLPDLAEEAEIIDIPQPAVAPPEEEEEGEEGAEGAEKSEEKTEEPN